MRVTPREKNETELTEQDVNQTGIPTHTNTKSFVAIALIIKFFTVDLSHQSSKLLA